MRFAHHRPGTKQSWTLAATAAIALLGCGREDSPAEPGTPAAGQAFESPAPGSADTAQSANSGIPEGFLLGGPIDGPIEFEPAVEKAVAVTFPNTQATEVTPPAVANLPAADQILGRPLVIAGKVIPFEEIKKQVCLDSTGVAEIERAKINIVIEAEQQRRRKEGASEEEVSLSAAEMDGFMKEIEKEVAIEYPEGDVEVIDVLNELGSANPQQGLRQQKLFEKLFVPEDPEKFPPLTVEAIMSREGGDSLIDSYRQTYQARMAEPTPRAKNKDDLFLDQLVVEQIVTHLNEKAQIQASPSPRVVLSVNGVDILSEDIWNTIKPLVTTKEVCDTKQWITNTTILRDALVKAGAWFSDDEADAAYHAHSDPYKTSIFSIERIALMFKHFPSVERYRDYRRLFESYKRMIASELTKEKIDQFAELRTNKVVGQVTVDADLILCSAFDFKAGRWKQNGWKEAESRMRDVVRLLVEEQRPWEELVEKYSEFYQAPIAVSQRAQVDPDRPQKGRFRGQQRNNMLSGLGESVYSMFLNGYSITDFMFFEQEVGTIGDPMRGPLGWYLPRLIKRSKPPERLPMAPEMLEQLKLEEYVMWRMDKFTQELIAQNEVYGLELP